MAKIITVPEYVRNDGTTVEEHSKVIHEVQNETLADKIKRKKRDEDKARLLEQFLGDDNDNSS